MIFRPLIWRGRNSRPTTIWRNFDDNLYDPGPRCALNSWINFWLREIDLTRDRNRVRETITQPTINDTQSMTTFFHHSQPHFFFSSFSPLTSAASPTYFQMDDAFDRFAIRYFEISFEWFRRKDLKEDWKRCKLKIRFDERTILNI